MALVFSIVLPLGVGMVLLRPLLGRRSLTLSSQSLIGLHSLVMSKLGLWKCGSMTHGVTNSL